jgi:phosphate transport system permease protein
MSAPARRKRTDLLGETLTALCGGALALNLLAVLFLLALLVAHGSAYFWQKGLVRLTLDDGTRLLGEIAGRERAPDGSGERLQLKVGNRDLAGTDFVWVRAAHVTAKDEPPDAVLLERFEWGNFYGFLEELRRGDEVLATGSDAVLRAFTPLHRAKREQAKAIERLERVEIGDVNYAMEALRLEDRALAASSKPAAEVEALRAALAERMARRHAEYEGLAQRLAELREQQLGETLVVASAGGERKEIPVGAVVRLLRPNEMGTMARSGLWLRRAWEFVSQDPRESNTEGGIFPAIFGTVMMVFLMSFAVVPLGVLAALYLREYARQGILVRLVRIAVNNLAGVPSIVFGVFGLGFFVYFIGGSIDRLFYSAALPTPTYGTGGILWASLTLALLTVPVVIVATEEGLAAVPRVVREGSLALGATKLETTWRVVIPAAAPGILTGLILAMARAAGEVAPLMIVGMVKLAPALPLDHHFPFVHLERKFMHLGFHVYDVGFQSPNTEATKPLVFATALLLILAVTAMNLAAIFLRNRLRKKYASSAV